MSTYDWLTDEELIEIRVLNLQIRDLTDRRAAAMKQRRRMLDRARDRKRRKEGNA